MLHNLVFMLAVAAIAAAVPGAAKAKTNLLFILDASNSMWGQVEGKPKIESAQRDLPQDTKVGLMVYGHRREDSCDDIELLTTIGADEPTALVKKIENLQPKGKTPIARSVVAFSKLEGQNNHVVLISDGMETCGGDVCVAASTIANAKISPHVHVVGFDVNTEERAKLACIPKMGNGRYFSAANTKELKQAIAEVKQVAETTLQPQKHGKTGPTEVFRDDFDGDELADHWEVLNPDPDAFIVEDGSLLVVSGTAGSLEKDTVQNLFKLSKPLPKGDWVITAKLSIDLQTSVERAFIGIHDSRDNYLEIGVRPWIECCYSPRLSLHGVKRSRGKNKTSDRVIWRSGHQGKSASAFADAAKNIAQPILLRLEKKGRTYTGSAMLAGAKKPRWVTLDKFTVLRLKGTVALGLYQTKKTNGETTTFFDWVKIETPGK